MVDDSFNRSEKIKRLIIISILFLVLILPYVVRMNTLPLPACQFKSITNLSCPTCGISRAYYSITQGSIDSALHYNFIGIIIYGGFLFLLFKYILELIRDKKFLKRIPKGVYQLFIIFILSGWFSFWIVRLIRESILLY